MIRCNLSILLAERNLKITKVCNDTGISRTTLTALCNNYSKGIQYDTLNVLCNYLKVKPNDLIAYIPVDIFIRYVHRDNEFLQINLEITSNGITRNDVGFYGFSYLSFNSDKHVCSVDIDISLWEPDNDEDTEQENKFIIEAFQQLTIPFLKDLERELITDILNDIEYEHSFDVENPRVVNFSWDTLLTKK